MPTPEVIARVRDLHAELAEAQPDVPMAAEVRQAVDQVLLEPAIEQHYASLNDRLKLAYATFEHDHPKLAGAMQATIAALSAAGI